MSLRARPFRDIVEDGFRYTSHAASGLAAGHIADIWTMQARTCRTAVEGRLPDMCAEIVFNLGRNGRHLVGPDECRPSTSPRAAWVIGPHADVLLVSKEIVDCEVVGVRLRPDVIPLVLGVPACELAGRMIDLELLWGEAVTRIRDQLSTLPAPSSRAELLEREVARRAQGCETSELATLRAIRTSLERMRGCSVREVADEFGLSHRRVITLFDGYVGLKPKRYQQVQRVRAVMHAVVSDGRRSLSGLAFDLGYTDQAHLANEFRRLTGLTVSSYLARRSPVGLGTVRHHPA